VSASATDSRLGVNIFQQAGAWGNIPLLSKNSEKTKDDPPGRRLWQGNQFLARDLFQDMSRRIDIRSGVCLFVDQSCERALRAGEQLGDPSVLSAL
jgi:hypothetical protein